MAQRETIGILVALAGLLLIPLGLFHNRLWWIAVVILVAVGLVIHRTKRVQEFEEVHGLPPGPSGGFGLRTDLIPQAPKFKGSGIAASDIASDDE